MAKKSSRGPSVIRLAISVEGSTEEEFINRVLASHLLPRGVAVHPILLGRARHGSAGGGDVSVKRLVTEMAFLFRSLDAVTSLVDFYGFRGKSGNTVDELEGLVRRDIERIVGANGNRIAPYVQRHEFEGLLFSDVSVFSVFVDVSPRAARNVREHPGGFSESRRHQRQHGHGTQPAHCRYGAAIPKASSRTVDRRGDWPREDSRRMSSVQFLGCRPGDPARPHLTRSSANQ